MEGRKIILFKINNEVVLEEFRDLYLNQIDELKWQVALECDVTIDQVDVEVVETPLDFSDDIDATEFGLVFWRALFHEPIKGVKCLLKPGSDAYLDRINDGTIIDYMVFYI